MKRFIFFAFLIFHFKKVHFCREFCGSALVFSQLEICCSGRVYEKPGFNSKCCGFKPYNTDLKLCCNNLILDKPYLNSDCCDYKFYNTEKQQCCYGNKIVSKLKRCTKSKLVIRVNENRYKMQNGPLRNISDHRLYGKTYDYA